MPTVVYECTHCRVRARTPAHRPDCTGVRAAVTSLFAGRFMPVRVEAVTIPTIRCVHEADVSLAAEECPACAFAIAHALAVCRTGCQCSACLGAPI